MALHPVSGCKFYIGGALAAKTADFVASDFDAISWTEVKEWTQMGTLGDTSQLITSDVIPEARTKKAKGTRNAGSMQNVFQVAIADAGQVALIAAEKTIFDYAFKVELNDKPAVGSAPTNSTRLFVGLVMSAAEENGGANNARVLNSTIEINSNIVRVAAASGD